MEINFKTNRLVYRTEYECGPLHRISVVSSEATQPQKSMSFKILEIGYRAISNDRQYNKRKLMTSIQTETVKSSDPHEEERTEEERQTGRHRHLLCDTGV